MNWGILRGVRCLPFRVRCFQAAASNAVTEPAWAGILPVVCASILAGTGSLAASDTSTTNEPQSGIADGGTNAFVNSLGMRFVQIKGKKLWFSIWETRVSDYRVFCEATDRPHTEPEFAQGPTHPVVNVNWEDAQAFCRWLTGKERNEGRLGAAEKYRLPTDEEWSAAAAGTEDGATPEKRMKSQKVWPWGHYWPPQSGDGNYGPSLKVDDYAATAPVGSFKPNPQGIFDLGGNVWEWCDDWYNEAQVTKTLRGGSFNDALPGYLLTSYRFSGTMNLGNEDMGFRVVLVR
jgi:formylglycine-generating enzyme required for sulfatase activity